MSTPIIPFGVYDSNGELDYFVNANGRIVYDKKNKKYKTMSTPPVDRPTKEDLARLYEGIFNHPTFPDWRDEQGNPIPAPSPTSLPPPFHPRKEFLELLKNDHTPMEEYIAKLTTQKDEALKFCWREWNWRPRAKKTPLGESSGIWVKHLKNSYSKAD